MSQTTIAILYMVFVVGIIALFARRAYRSKFSSSQTIVTQFAPPEGLSPLMVGLLQDSALGLDDLLGGLMDLAQRHIVSFEEDMSVGKDYVVTLLGEPSSIVDEIDSTLLKIIFGDTLAKGVAQKLSELKEVGIIGDQRQQNIFEMLSPFARTRFENYKKLGDLLSHKLESLGLVTLQKGSIIPVTLLKLTPTGEAMRAQILGFGQYLKSVYGNKYEAYPLPTAASKDIVDFLPYAIALGITSDIFMDIEAKQTDTDRRTFFGHRSTLEDMYYAYKKYY